MSLTQRIVGVAFLAATLFACGEQPLRGTVAKSPDGRTYLVVAAAEAPCDHVNIDGVRSRVLNGVLVPIQPGAHRLSCGGDGIQFEVDEGTTLTFDYWGP